MVKSKWRRQYKIDKDKKQTRFTQTGKIEEPVRVVSIIDQAHSVTEQFFCPFCLHIDKLARFLMSTGKGYHKGLGKCPECGNQMRLSTLVAEWTPEQYAEFAYPYASSGFWQKVPFQKWKERLYKLGWAQRFWGRYKELKGEGEEESYERHLQRQQEEYAQELADEHE